MNGYPRSHNHSYQPHGSRMLSQLPLDLSYNNQPAHQSPPDLYFHNPAENFFNTYPAAPLTYYDMDTGQMNSRNALMPPIAHLPAHLPQPTVNMVRINQPPNLNLNMSSSTKVTRPSQERVLPPPPSTCNPVNSKSSGSIANTCTHQSITSLSSRAVISRVVSPPAVHTAKTSIEPSNSPAVPLQDLNVDNIISDIVMGSRVDTQSPKSQQLTSSSTPQESAKQTPRRMRRNVEPYQVIHEFKGKRKPVTESPLPSRLRRKSSNFESQTVTPTKSSASKTSESASLKKTSANGGINKTIMVPDSTTRSPVSTPTIDLSQSNSVNAPLTFSKDNVQFTPKSQTSKILSIEDEVTLIKQSELKRKSLTNGISNAISNTSSDDLQADNLSSDQSSSISPRMTSTRRKNNQESRKSHSSLVKCSQKGKDSPSNKTQPKSNSHKKLEGSAKDDESAADEEVDSSAEEEEPPNLIVSGKRRVSQTKFFQVVYPQPKRKKSVDQQDSKKSKMPKSNDSSSGPTPPHKGWRGKSNDSRGEPTPPHKGWRGKSNVITQNTPEKHTPNVELTVQVTPLKDGAHHKQKTSSDDSKCEETSTDTERKSEVKEDKKEEEEEVLTEGRTVGRLVWGKLTSRCKPWPGVTIRGSDAAQVPPSADHQWIFWYGEHKVSEVQLCRLQDFDTGFQKAFKLGSGNLYTTAVVEALTDSWELLQGSKATKDVSTTPEGLDGYLEWVADAFQAEENILPHGKVSKFVAGKLANIVEMINNAEDSTDYEDDDNDEDFERRRTPSSKSKRNNQKPEAKKTCRSDSLSKVRDGAVDLENVCLACGAHSNLQPHPLFKGGVCDDCLEDVKSSFFSFGADGCMSYCVLCGRGDVLLVCDSNICGRTYCKSCVTELGSLAMLMVVEESSPWECFLCKPITVANILIQAREDWKQRLMRFYQKPSKLHNLPECKPDRKLRVMSLFDGIGTAMVVLKNLNLDVEVYYSLEIEEDAIQVVQINHGEEVFQLGDIRSLTEEKLAALGRIDLLVGGSPCNDLALVNPARKGLYDATGTGILFFDFYRILMTLKSLQPNHAVLWLFENVVHMNKETKATISRFLECEPVKLDAGVFSAQSRARYFWGNIPGMFIPVTEDMKALNISLQDVLSKGREAAVTKIRTVTTRGASLLQGKNEDMHAVRMNGHSDKLWPTELESVFGLPKHYTDAGNLAPGKRQKLLGRSWCVPVIEHILKPLTHLFAVKPERKPCSCSSK